MTPILSGFQRELEKLGHLNIRALQLALAQKIFGIDPTMPTPYKGSPLDEEVSRLQMEERLRGMPKMGAAWVTPRTVRRIADMSGLDEDSPRFKSIAASLTGTTRLQNMDQHQLRILGSVLAGRPL